MRNHGRDQCGVRTHDPEDARQTPYPVGHRSPLLTLFVIFLRNDQNQTFKLKYSFNVKQSALFNIK